MPPPLSADAKLPSTAKLGYRSTVTYKRSTATHKGDRGAVLTHKCTACWESSMWPATPGNLDRTEMLGLLNSAQSEPTLFQNNSSRLLPKRHRLLLLGTQPHSTEGE